MRADFFGLSIFVICMAVVAACTSGPGALNSGNPTTSDAPVVRVVRSQGETKERLSSILPGEKPNPTAFPTPTLFEPRPPTSTATPTPSATRTVTSTPTRTVTPTNTPRGGADILGAVAAFQSIERYRAQLSGPADIIQEVDGPDKLHIFISGNQSVELIVAYGIVYQRSGGRWFPRPDATSGLVDRLDRFIAPLANIRRTYRAIGVTRTRAGRCLDWDVENNGPNEPIAICIGVVDQLVYRLRFPGDMIVEFYDFNRDVVVAEPFIP